MSIQSDPLLREGVTIGGPNPFAFVVGCPRSGTTLLQRMLDAHGQIAVLPEIPWLSRLADDPQAVTAEGFVRPALLRRLIERPSFGRYASLPVSRAELEALLASDRPLRYVDLIAWLFDRHGAARDKPLIANKTVGHELEIGRLSVLWPRARVVHLIRDGRDVSLSATRWRRAPKLAARYRSWERDPVVGSALWWEWHVRSGREAGAQLGRERYREVFYEDLVRWPDATCAALCAFLGITYDDAMVHFHEGRARPESGLDAKHAWRPPTPGLRDWRTQMAPDDLERWEATSGDLLDDLGYQHAGRRPSATALAWSAELRGQFEGRPLPARWRRAAGTPEDGRTIWLTGLSGAGKSTVARIVARELRERGTNVEVLDGDVMRSHLCDDLGFTKDDRDTNVRRIAFVAGLLARNGVTVIVAAISPYRAAREAARAVIGGRFVEVHVEASVAVCSARDVKGLYEKAFAGEIEHFTGVSDPYQPPTEAEVVLVTERETPEQSAAKLIAYLDGREYG